MAEMSTSQKASARAAVAQVADLDYRQATEETWHGAAQFDTRDQHAQLALTWQVEPNKLAVQSECNLSTRALSFHRNKCKSPAVRTACTTRSTRTSTGSSPRTHSPSMALAAPASVVAVALD
jgi:hypothetical protein